jgi:hypothetical protein
MKTIIALAVAAVWSVGLLIVAVTVPFYRSTSVTSSATYASPSPHEPAPQQIVTTSSATLVAENGTQVLAVVAIPALAVLAVGLSLRHRWEKAKPGAGPVAWTVVSLLGAFTLVAMFSIGIFVLPVSAALLFACASM